MLTEEDSCSTSSSKEERRKMGMWRINLIRSEANLRKRMGRQWDF